MFVDRTAVRALTPLVMSMTPGSTSVFPVASLSAATDTRTPVTTQISSTDTSAPTTSARCHPNDICGQRR